MKMNKKIDLINEGSENEMKIEGFQLSQPKYILSWLLTILTLGFLKLIFYWRPDLMLKFTHQKCELNKSTKVLLTDKYNQQFVEKIQHLTNSNINQLITNNLDDKEENSVLLTKDTEIQYFTNKKWKYLFNKTQNNYEKLKGLEDDYSFRYFQQQTGLNDQEQTVKRSIYGDNSISVSITPILKLFVREILTPFYIFQIFSMALWYYEKYIYFATCIVVISVVSIVYSLHSIRRNERALRNMIHNINQVCVFRKKRLFNSKNEPEYDEITISSNDLVPGDIIEIKNLTIMQCDALLLEDANAIVNESMLTGESIPITKTGIGSNDTNDIKLNTKEHKKHILFSGTQVIQTRIFSTEKARAIVLRTGFNTAKGELVRTILYPKPSEFRFDLDLYKYIGALTVISILGMIYTMFIMLRRHNPIKDMILRSLDLITIVVPPALPGALTACLIYAQNRLKKSKIYCISPNRINVCGSINVFVFDKTGTLTEDAIDIKCVLPASESMFNDEIKTVSDLSLKNEFHNKIVEILSCCHSLTRIDNNLAGDPLDLKLFEFTQWIFTENETLNEGIHFPTIVYPADKSDHKIGIIKQFPFSSTLQRMSVIVKCLNRPTFDFYSKGSPEIIASQCNKDTLPANFNTILDAYSSKGYRLIAISSKQLGTDYTLINSSDRDDLEIDMQFLGLIIMENRLKKETSHVINRLNMANIRSIMCTGDNILTGLSVATECGMCNTDEMIISIETSDKDEPVYKHINSGKSTSAKTNYIINGSSFEVIRLKYPEIFDNLIEDGTIFARMSPEQKQQLIEALQSKGYFVGMCGDGANDCGALKAANAGISLSEAEASIASPFTSKVPNIECTETLIREGRGCLVTSFGLVKFICMYSLTNFVSVILLYSIGYYLSDSEFLYIDMGLVTFIAFFFSQTDSFPVLDLKSPSNKLIAWRPISSLVFHALWTFVIQLLGFYYIQLQPWYEMFCEDLYAKGYLGPYENTAVFIISSFQYLTVGVIFSSGLPYRKNIFTNKFLIIFLLWATGFNLFLGLNDFTFIQDFINYRFIPDFKFRLIVIGIAVIHFFVSFIFESFLFDSKNFI